MEVVPSYTFVSILESGLTNAWITQLAALAESKSRQFNNFPFEAFSSLYKWGRSLGL